IGRRCMWPKISRRMSYMVCWPTRCMMRIWTYWARKSNASTAKKSRLSQPMHDHDEAEDHAPFVRLHVLQEPPHQARIVRFAEGLFFVQVAHARSSSSSSNCFWYKSA